MIMNDRVLYRDCDKITRTNFSSDLAGTLAIKITLN